MPLPLAHDPAVARALFDGLSDAVFLIDPDADRVLDANPPALRLTGFTRGELLAVPATELFAFDDPGGRRRLPPRFADTMTFRGQDGFVLATRDAGVVVPVVLSVSRLPVPPAGVGLVVARDDRERRAAAGRAADAAARLGREHAVLAALFDSLPDIVCYKDRDLKFVGGNRAFEELAGRPMRELVGVTCADVLHGEWADRFRAAEAGILAEGRAVRADEWVTYPGGRRALVDFVITPWRDAAGAVAGLVVVGRDVTEQRRLEQQARQSQRLEAVARLAGGVAHDFNNLLTVVLGNLQLAREGVDIGGGLAAAETAARQAADLTRQLQGFTSRRPPAVAAVDVPAAAAECLALARHSLDPRVVVEVAAADGLWAAAVDPGQFEQVLMNLFLNARDAMPGGGTLSVTAANATTGPGGRAGEFVRVTVADTGAGMAPEVAARAFEPFFTTKRVGEGSGLGLSAVYGMVIAHGGAVELASEPGRGTRVDVYLPRAAGTAAAPPPAPPLNPPAGRTVLLVDDERPIRELGVAVLRGAGFRVLTADNGAAAADLYRAERDAGRPVALVVMDLCMPVMSGQEAFARIREADPAARVLFASGYSPQQAPAGGAGFLRKPYTPAELVAAVRAAAARESGIADACAAPPGSPLNGGG